MTGSERRPATSPRRLAVILSLLAAAVVAALVGPSVVAPGHSSTAFASTSPTCNVSGCAKALAAYNGWLQFAKQSAKPGKPPQWPTDRNWKKWQDGSQKPWHYSGGTYYNYEHNLPSGASYNEYDVNGHAQPINGQRGLERIIVNLKTGATWYTPDHYKNFYKIR